MRDLNKKPLVIITGASSGIGVALSQLFSSNGYAVGMLARNKEAMEKLNLSNSMSLAIDVCDFLSYKKSIDILEEKFGPVDCFINNAGISKVGDFLDNEHDIHEKIIDVNIKGVLNGLEIILPKMRKNKNGTIINMSSLADRNKVPQIAVYGATKAAVKSLSESLRAASAKYGIRICNVAPALVNTPMLDEYTTKFEHTIPAEEFAKTILWIYEQPKNICIRDIVIAPTFYEN